MKRNAFINVENTISDMFRKEFAVFTRNGTTAIWLILEAMGFKKKKIIVPTNICFVVVCAIILSGNEPYFVDIDDDFSIDAGALKGIRSKEVAGIIFPHMYGNAGGIGKVAEAAAKKGWFVLEDVAQALGARVGKRYAGSFSDFSITSFGMGKIIDINMGGMLCTNNKTVFREALKIQRRLPVLNDSLLAAYMRFNQIYCLMVDCMERGDSHFRFGAPLANTYRDANLNRAGADLCFLPQLETKLQALDKELEIRRANAKLFQSTLRNRYIQPLWHNEGATYWRQNILVKKDRNGLLSYLKEKGIKASKYFPSIDKLFYARGQMSFKRSDSMASQIINLWPGKETKYIDIIKAASLINRFYKGGTVK